MPAKRRQPASSKKTPPSNKKLANPDLKEVRDILSFSYNFARTYFDRANQDHELYEQIIDPDNWTTMSEMTLGGAYRIVQNALPNLMFSVVWAPEYPFSLIPDDVDLDDESSMELSRKTREWLIYNLRDRMKIESKGMATAFDGVKLGCGYGVVEPVTIYSIDRTKTKVRTETEEAESFGLDVSEPRTVIRYRPAPFGSILPTPDGSQPDDCTAVTFVDMIDEVTFRAMYDNPDSNFMGNPETIIAYAKQNGFDASTFTVRSIIAKLSGYKSDHISRFGMERRNCQGITLIPIVKQFRKDRHIWVACDKFVIYKSDRTPQTLQCPVLKYAFCPEGDQWFTRGIVSPNRDLIRNNEMFENAMLDYFSLHLHPHQIVNMELLQEENAAEDLQPYAKTFVRGEPTRAQAFVTPPQLPPSVTTMGDRMQSHIRENTAQSSQEPTPGLMRGGSQALEAVNQTSTDRERMLAKHLENTWYSPLIQLTLIYASIYAGDKEEFRVVKTENDESAGARHAKPGKKSITRKIGDKYFESIKVTKDDLSHVWRVAIDFRDKLKNFLAESSHRLQVFDRLVQDPTVNPEELKHYLIGDEAQVKKLLSGVDKEARMRDIERLAKAGAAKQPLSAMAPGGNLGGGGAGTAASGMPMGGTGTPGMEVLAGGM
jgi:hypothetical protein